MLAVEHDLHSFLLFFMSGKFLKNWVPQGVSQIMRDDALLT